MFHFPALNLHACRLGSILLGCILLVAPAVAQLEMSATRVGSNLERPIFATVAPGETGRMFVVEQRGNIEILDTSTGSVNGTPFLTINNMASGNEQGLLGLAFHPDYQSNGLLYVNYTNNAGHTVIEEYSRSSMDQADGNSGRTLLTINQPFSNHNGGWMDFGPDGLLYISSGDGGGSGDPQNNAQDTTDNLLGKILRIDPLGSNSANGQYGIPSTNPLVGASGDDEIWAYGLRNPWRPSFDRQTGDLYIADVGQGAKEEINVQSAASAGGENYGWKVREGTSGSSLSGAIDPIYDYNHGSGDLEGFSVTGGYVYRGPIEAIQGHYFFADFINQRIWSLKWDGSDAATFDGTNFTDFIDWTDAISTDAGSIGRLSSFAEDEAGNLFLVDLDGEIFRIDTASVPEPSAGLGMITLGLLCLLRRKRTLRFHQVNA